MIYGNETCFVENWYADRYGTKNQTTVNSVSTADYGVIDLTSTGTDAYIHMPSLGSFAPATYKYVHILYKVVSGAAFTPQIFFYNAEGGASSTRVVTGPVYNVDGAWHVMTIDMSGHAKWLDSNITGFRFDWANVASRNALFGYFAFSSSATPPYECEISSMQFPYVPTANAQLYTSGSGNWTCPAGVTEVYVECWGGGGGGGYTNYTSPGYIACAGGGGGGAYAASTISVTPGNSYAYSVGAGGVENQDGGDTTFNSTSVVADGGKKGAYITAYNGGYSSGGAGGTTAGSTGTIKYAGGSAAKGYYDGTNYMGGGGGGGAGSGGAGDSANTGTSTAYVGGTGTAYGGGNGGSAKSRASGSYYAGGVGNNYGGGGAGALSFGWNGYVDGGNGANGAVRITYEV
jgi:hypothetical protein